MNRLNKKTLKLLEIEHFPTVIETSQITFNVNNRNDYNGCRLKYLFTSKMLNDTENSILVVTFFDLEDRIAKFRIFFTNDNFITELLYPERKWSNATLDSMSRERCYSFNAICSNENSARIIQSFFKSDDSPFETISAFQKALREKQLAKRHQKEIDRIDERMKAIHPLPKDFQKWVNEVPLNFSRYIFYKRVSKKLINGYCTSCKNDVEFHITKKTPWKNIRHRQQGNCPSCKKIITYMAKGKLSHQVDTSYATYIQKTQTGLVLRYFDITKSYSTDPELKNYYQNPVLYLHESGRHFIDKNDNMPDNTKHYEFGKFKRTGNWRWYNSLPAQFSWRTFVYTRNLNNVFRNTLWRYSAFYELAKNVDFLNIQTYLRSYINHPCYEYLVKARLYALVVDTLSFSSVSSDLNLDGKTLPETVGLDKIGFRQLQRLNGTHTHIKLIKLFNKFGKHLTDNQLRTFVELGIYTGVLEDLLNFTTPQKIINYIKRCLMNWKKELYNRSETTISTHWRDYLKNCKLMGYDTTNDIVLFPRDLKARHDEVTKAYRVGKNEIQEKAIHEMYQTAQAVFGFAHVDLGLIAVAPATRRDIISEGEILEHCVHTGSYMDRMVEGSGNIIFIRKADAPGTPYYTAEITDGVIQQCRGLNNREMTDDVKKFVRLWQNNLHKRNVKTIAIPAAHLQTVA